MALLRIDAKACRPCLADGTAPWAALHRHLAAMGKSQTVVIVTHGLRYGPGRQGSDPHATLLSAAPDGGRHWKCRSLPRRLHLGQGQIRAGQGIAFGWNGMGSLWRALHQARTAGLALAHLCVAIRSARPDLRISVMTHSLGARVVTEAMLRAPIPVIDRALLLTPADYRGRAARALAAPGGRLAHVVAVQTRENWLFSTLFAAALPPWRTLAWGPDHARWVDFLPDRMAQMGIAPPTTRICHWSSYLRPGLWPLYRSWMTGGAPLEMFRAPQ
ncbi:MAG: hypothetical protein AAGK57_14000, partial [Pseudomonadota bacterium]